MKNISIMLCVVLLFIGVINLFGDNLPITKQNIKKRAEKHILNIKNFENCIDNVKKEEGIKLCKDNMEKVNVQIQRSSGMN